MARVLCTWLPFASSCSYDVIAMASLRLRSGCLAGLLASLGWLFAAVGPTVAQDEGLGTQGEGLAFLRIGPNAAAGAMGDAQVASSADAFSTFWNPAGLAAASQNSAALSFYAWVADTGSYTGTVRLGAGERGGVGLFVTAMGSTGLEARSRPGESEGTFDVQFVSAGASYGRHLGPVRAGITAKYLTERIFVRTSQGYAFDFGVQADLPVEGVQVGMTLQNIGSMSRLVDRSTPLPRILRGGVALHPFRVRFSDEDGLLLRTSVAVDLVHSLESDQTGVHVGIGADLLGVAEFRGGYVVDDALRGLSLGLGFGLGPALFDYAWVSFESGFGGPGHVLTLTYPW